MRGLIAIAALTMALLGTAAVARPDDQDYGQGYGQGFDQGYGPGGGQWHDHDHGDWNGGNSDWNGGKWDTIGEKTVNSGFDRDHLKVHGNDRYRKIRVCSLDRPIELNGLSVEFHNGERQDFPVNMELRRGDCSPSFDLDGRRRNMDDVWLSYSKLRHGGEPRVAIQAR